MSTPGSSCVRFRGHLFASEIVGFQLRTNKARFVPKRELRAPVAYVFGVICSQVRSSGSSCVRFRPVLFPSESPEGKKGSEGEGGDEVPEDEGCGGGDGGDEVNEGNGGDDGNDGEDDKGGNVGPEGEPSTAARVATEIRAAVKGRRAE